MSTLRRWSVVGAQCDFCTTHSPSRSEKPTVPVDILSNRYLKNTFRIDYKKRLPCFCRYYGAILEYSYFAYKSHIFGKKEHLLSNWESRE